MVGTWSRRDSEESGNVLVGDRNMRAKALVAAPEAGG